jgi:hypothetical protein
MNNTTICAIAMGSIAILWAQNSSAAWFERAPGVRCRIGVDTLCTFNAGLGVVDCSSSGQHQELPLVPTVNGGLEPRYVLAGSWMDYNSTVHAECAIEDTDEHTRINATAGLGLASVQLQVKDSDNSAQVASLLCINDPDSYGGFCGSSVATGVGSMPGVTTLSIGSTQFPTHWSDSGFEKWYSYVDVAIDTHGTAGAVALVGYTFGS